MPLAAKHFDPITGVDIHIVLIPTPGGPVPTPIPHPFVGMLWDIPDYVPIVGSTVLINGAHRAIAGTAGRNLPMHIPIGGPFAKPPANECEMYMGSSTVTFDGEAASYMSLPSLSCQDVGSPPPARTNKKKKTKLKTLVLPSSVVLPISAGAPVLIGGSPTISLTSLATGVAFDALGKGLKKLKKLKKAKVTKNALKSFRDLRKKMFKNIKPGFLKCNILRAEPVNAVTGEVTLEQEDFSLPWRIPFKWTRCYGSQSFVESNRVPGWETPADTRLVVAEDGSVLFYDGELGPTTFARLPPTDDVGEIDPISGSELRLVLEPEKAGKVSGGPSPFSLRVRTRDGRFFHFHTPTRGLPARIERISDAPGNRIDFCWNGHGLYAIREGSGLTIRVEADDGCITEMWLKRPSDKHEVFLVEYEYNEARRLVGVRTRDRSSPFYRFAYDRGRMTQHTNRNGLSFYYKYAKIDGEWKCVHSWGDGGLYNYRFDYHPGETHFIDSLGAKTVLRYGEDFLPFQELDALGASTFFEYDEHGRTRRVVNAYGYANEYAYDEHGNTLRERDPEGHELRRAFDERNRLTSFEDPTGGKWAITWNEQDRVVARISPEKVQYRYAYEPTTGDLTSATDPLGRTTTYRNDPHGFLSEVLDPLRGRTGVHATALGEVERLVEPGGRVLRYEYSLAGNLRKVVRPSGATQGFLHDSEGNLLEFKDARGLVTRFSWTGIGQLAERTAPDGTSVVYTYDSEERLSFLRNERGQTYFFSRDALGRAVKVRDYWGAETLYDYDALGNVRSKTDPLGQKTTYAQDRLGRIVRSEYPDQDGISQLEEISYDAWGNAAVLRNAVASVERLYDAHNRLKRELQGRDWVEYDYDLCGNRIAHRSSLGNEIGYEYDELDRLLAVRDQRGDRDFLRFHYDASGDRVREELAGGLVRERTFTKDGDVASQAVRRGDGGVIASRRFQYDAEGNLLARHDAKRGVDSYDYDPRDRIRRWTNPSGAIEDFLRDPVGDLLRGTHSPLPDGSRELSYRDGHYAFDRAGRLTHRRLRDKAYHYEWDARDRLTRSTDSNGTVTRMGYDVLGRRLWKDGPLGRVEFVWDGDRLLGERTANDPAEHLVEPNTFLCFGVLSSSTLKHLESDGAGHPFECIDAAGEVIWARTLDASGSPYGDANSNGVCAQGGFEDPETNLYYVRHRHLVPEAAVFASTDPLGIQAGANLFEGCPNPWAWIDPNGLTSTKCRLLGDGNRVPNAGGKIVSSVTEKDEQFYRVFSGNETTGSFLTKVRPKNRAFAKEALALPPGNKADKVQRVFVPAGTRLQRSRALPAFGRRGGGEQFELMERIPQGSFGPGMPLQ